MNLCACVSFILVSCLSEAFLKGIHCSTDSTEYFKENHPSNIHMHKKTDGVFFQTHIYLLSGRKIFLLLHYFEVDSITRPENKLQIFTKKPSYLLDIFCKVRISIINIQEKISELTSEGSTSDMVSLNKQEYHCLEMPRQMSIKPIDSEVSAANHQSSNVAPNRTKVLTFLNEFSIWNDDWSFAEDILQKKNNLNGLTLHGIIALNDILQDDSDIVKYGTDVKPNAEVRSLTQSSLTIFECLKEMYNFQWELSIVGADTFFTPGNVYKQENMTDFVITFENKNEEILTTSYMLPAINSLRHTFVFSHPPIYTSPSFYIKPMSLVMWTCIGAILAGSSILLCISCLFNIEDSDNNEISFVGWILLSLGTITNQGLSIESSRISKRILQFNLLQFGVIIGSFYNSVILNYLLYPLHISIQSFDQIIEEGYEIGIENLPFNKISYFDGYSEARNIKINNIFNLSKLYELPTGVEKMRKSKFALLSIDTNIYSKASEYFTDPEICSLVGVTIHNSSGITMYIKKTSPYKELLQRGLLSLREVGIIDREEKLRNQGKAKCFGTSQFVEIGLQSISFANKVFLSGVFLSFFIYLLELILMLAMEK